MRRDVSKPRSCAGVTVRVNEEYQVAEARRASMILAGAMGFGATELYGIATSVSELASNLFFHASDGGTITVSSVTQNGRVGIEIVAEDAGPGIPDVKLAMRDGFSTAGGLGSGLPGVERLMDEMQVTSTPGAGTRVVARKWRPGR